MPPALRVLLIEDDEAIRRFLRVSLKAQGFEIEEAGTGRQGLTLASMRRPDLAILDLGLPDMDGIDLIRKFRELCSAPVIIVSARGQEKDKVLALDAGADDYLTKPFGMGELQARIRVALRHNRQTGAESAGGKIEIGELKIDLEARRVACSGNEIKLTPTEYRLVTTLAQHAGKVLTHRFLLKEVWGASYVEETQYLRVFMAGLRRKLEQDPSRPRFLLTEQGVGYRFAEE